MMRVHNTETKKVFNTRVCKEEKKKELGIYQHELQTEKKNE